MHKSRAGLWTQSFVQLLFPTPGYAGVGEQELQHSGAQGPTAAAPGHTGTGENWVRRHRSRIRAGFEAPAPRKSNLSNPCSLLPVAHGYIIEKMPNRPLPAARSACCGPYGLI